MEIPNFPTLCLYFFIYSCIGWGVEVLYIAITTHQLVNRGFLNGPFCPVYGVGVIFLLIFLTPLADNIILLFFAAILMTSLIEYITGYLMETAFHTTWWDYSDQPLNLKGRICLKNSLYWGVGALIIVRYVHPHMTAAVAFFTPQQRSILSWMLLMYLMADTIISVSTAIGFHFHLRQLHSLSQDIALRLEYIRNTTREKAGDLDLLAHELRSRYDRLLNQRFISHRRILKAFPRLQSKKFEGTLQELRRNIISASLRKPIDKIRHKNQ